MNVSTINRNSITKATIIQEIKSDIIFLSDMRLGNQERKISDLFKLNFYKLIVNSSKSKRGVGILIRNTLDFELLDIYRDRGENILLLNCKLNKVHLCLGAIYGPNTNNTADEFFTDLATGLTRFQGIPTVIGGDWNATLSTAPVQSNLDVANMANIPSAMRSERINALSTEFDLMDPFRYVNPTLRDYSYEPHGSLRRNRSRLDYFLVSEAIANQIKKCFISDKLFKKSFDHRTVVLQMGKTRKSGRSVVKTDFS